MRFKRAIPFFFLSLPSFYLTAQQNLVVNPSFEIHTACPDNTGGDVYKATGWDTCHQSADYFNTCATFSYFHVPSNALGFQYPAYGNAYCGFISHDGSTFYRECIIGTLTSPLVISLKYFISFKVSCADSLYTCGYSTNKLGVRMSTTIQYNVPINNTAHFYSNTVVTDTAGWTRLSGSFIADSAYQYIMIGNFFDDLNTTVTSFQSGNIGYHYIDEVCLSTDSIYTANYVTGIDESAFPNQGNIYPNPANNVISIAGLDPNGDLVRVFDSLGRLILSEEVRSDRIVLNCSFWPDGIYLIKTGNTHRKVIINH